MLSSTTRSSSLTTSTNSVCVVTIQIPACATPGPSTTYFPEPCFPNTGVCYPTTYYDAQDQGHMSISGGSFDSQMMAKCKAVCDSQSLCAAFVGTENITPDGTLATGTCFLYSSQLLSPRQCANSSSRIIAYYKSKLCPVFTISSITTTKSTTTSPTTTKSTTTSSTRTPTTTTTKSTTASPTTTKSTTTSTTTTSGKTTASPTTTKSTTTSSTSSLCTSSSTTTPSTTSSSITTPSTTTSSTTSSSTTTTSSTTTSSSPTPNVGYLLQGTSGGGDIEALEVVLTVNSNLPCSYDGSYGEYSYSGGVTVIGARGLYNAMTVSFDSSQTLGSGNDCVYPTSSLMVDFLGLGLVAGGHPYNFFNGADIPR